MAGKRYLLLEVDASRYDELTKALTTRSYIKSIDLFNLKDRSYFSDCPVCAKPLIKEWVGTVTEQMVTGCYSILVGMIKTKTVVLYNKSFIDNVRPIDRSRAVSFPYKLLFTARSLGIIGHYLDGDQDTFFITNKGMKFLVGSEDLSPSQLTFIDYKVVGSEGKLNVEYVKAKDKVGYAATLLNIKDTIKRLPSHVLEFIQSGQTSISEGAL